jgi:glucosamine-6-phosphate deaminase
MENRSDYLMIPAADLPSQSKVNVEVLPDTQAVLQHFARSVADEIRANNAIGRPTCLILPVGPVGQYPLLVEICNRERISWQNTHTFNMDDYCDWQGRPLPPDHPLSFRGFMRQHLYERLDSELRIPQEQMHFPDPFHLDSLSQEIAALGGIDTCYGGVGYHGHVAFNEPPISRWHKVSIEAFKHSQTRLVMLAPDSIVMNSIRNTGGNPLDFPPMGVTMGLRDILASRRIRMYCPGGAWQRYPVRVALFGEPAVEYPVTLLQEHPDYALIIDEETAQPPSASLI